MLEKQLVITMDLDRESPSMIFDDEEPIEETHANAVPLASDRERVDVPSLRVEESQATVDVKMDLGRPVPNIHSSFKHALLNNAKVIGKLDAGAIAKIPAKLKKRSH